MPIHMLNLSVFNSKLPVEISGYVSFYYKINYIYPEISTSELGDNKGGLSRVMLVTV